MVAKTILLMSILGQRLPSGQREGAAGMRTSLTILVALLHDAALHFPENAAVLVNPLFADNAIKNDVPVAVLVTPSAVVATANLIHGLAIEVYVHGKVVVCD